MLLLKRNTEYSDAVQSDDHAKQKAKKVWDSVYRANELVMKSS